MRLRELNPSRKRLRAGDVFAAQLIDGRYVFGRVIRTDARVGPITDMNLVYVYRATSVHKQAPGGLSPRDLLVAPFIINRLPWSRGYFETVGNQPLKADEVLPKHCFYEPMTGRYVDELDNPLDGRSEPCGIAALNGFGSAGEAIAEALGIADPGEESQSGVVGRAVH